MSAIYGLVRFDGAQVESSELDAMADAIRYWGSDGGGAWRAPDGMAGLGQLVRYDLPESRRECGVLALGGGSHLTATARLDNREELLRELSLPADSTESAIVGEAWRKWERESVSRLHGDWAFAVWDSSRRELFLARDPFGTRALYHTASGAAFAFASSRKAFFALPFIPRRLNELRLAQHFAMWITDGEATLHEKVFRLPPGHHLTAGANGVTVTRYWFPEDVPELRLRSDAQYIERFLELYANAVRVRTRTERPVTSTLSSGLDSGSVTALAARQLRAHGKSLVAFTSVPLHPQIAALAPRMVVDEWSLARATAEWIGDVDHRALRSESVTPIAALERSLWLHDEPEFAAGNLYWLIDLLEQSQALGAGVMLTGQMGNGGVSWAGDQQRVLRGLMRGRWIDAWRGLRSFQRLRGTSLLRAAWAQVVAPLRMKISSVRFRRGTIEPPSAKMMFAPAFAREIGVTDRMRAAGYDPFPSALMGPVDQRLRILLPSINPIGALWDESGAGYGLDVRDPTCDVRLLEYCLSVPDSQHSRDGQDRLLMRRSMEGLLPPSVQWNQQRGRQGADLLFRLRADASAVSAAVAEVSASPVARQYLNVAGIRDMWALQRQTVAPSAINSAHILVRALLFGLFLAREPFRG